MKNYDVVECQKYEVEKVLLAPVVKLLLMLEPGGSFQMRTQIVSLTPE